MMPRYLATSEHLFTSASLQKGLPTGTWSASLHAKSQWLQGSMQVHNVFLAVCRSY